MSCSGWKSGWEGWKMPAERNKAGACCLHPPSNPVCWTRLAKAGNVTPGHRLLLSNGNSCYEPPVPSAFPCKTNITPNSPFLSKKSSCKERFPLKWKTGLCTWHQRLPCCSQLSNSNIFEVCFEYVCCCFFWCVFFFFLCLFVFPPRFAWSASLSALKY